MQGIGIAISILCADGSPSDTTASIILELEGFADDQVEQEQTGKQNGDRLTEIGTRVESSRTADRRRMASECGPRTTVFSFLLA